MKNKYPYNKNYKNYDNEENRKKLVILTEFKEI